MFLEMQINYLLWIQHLREALGGFFDPFFLAVTNFGEVAIALSFAACIYWAVNKRVGEYLIMAHVFILTCCQFLKMLFCIPRPWMLSDKIKPVEDAIGNAQGYSFPSGHTSCATSIWGGLVVECWHKKIVRYLLIGLILVVAFSRHYLGVHTPQDIIIAILVSVVILLILKKVFDKKIYDTKIVITGIILALIVTTSILIKSHFYPELIVTNNSLKSFIVNMGYIFGALCGWYLCSNWVKFDTENCSIRKRLLRASFGILTLNLILSYGRATYTGINGSITAGFIYAGFIGMYLTCIYPWIFTKIEKRIEEKKQENI